MDATLEEVRSRLTAKYLGQFGIHAISARRKDGVIVIYVAPDACVHLPAEVEAEARPFTIQVVKSPIASALS